VARAGVFCAEAIWSLAAMLTCVVLDYQVLCSRTYNRSDYYQRFRTLPLRGNWETKLNVTFPTAYTPSL
jgi:hypothetical protein